MSINHSSHLFPWGSYLTFCFKRWTHCVNIMWDTQVYSKYLADRYWRQCDRYTGENTVFRWGLNCLSVTYYCEQTTPEGSSLKQKPFPCLLLCGLAVGAGIRWVFCLAALPVMSHVATVIWWLNWGWMVQDGLICVCGASYLNVSLLLPSFLPSLRLVSSVCQETHSGFLHGGLRVARLSSESCKHCETSCAQGSGVTESHFLHILLDKIA